jgi:hypothetical protein
MRWNKFPPLFLFTGYTVGVRFAEHLDDIEPVIGAGFFSTETEHCSVPTGSIIPNVAEGFSLPQFFFIIPFTNGGLIRLWRTATFKKTFFGSLYLFVLDFPHLQQWRDRTSLFHYFFQFKYLDKIWLQSSIPL